MKKLLSTVIQIIITRYRTNNNRIIIKKIINIYIYTTSQNCGNIYKLDILEVISSNIFFFLQKLSLVFC